MVRRVPTSGSEELDVRAVTVDDWRLLRDVRVRALTDAPDAFGATAATARALTDDDWRDRARSSGLTLVAALGERAVAMGGARRPPGAASYDVWGMWSGPEVRGRGVGGRILDDLLAWCRAESSRDGVGDVVLHVTEGNDAARRLYVGRGFAPTGVWESLRAGSGLRVEELRLRLTPASTPTPPSPAS